jgi:type II secretory pathway predicted ATPase ExeA
MFLEFYNLKEQPFGVTPDPRFLYLGENHREALASLYYGIESDRGFVALIAPPGLGKTTLAFQLLEKLQQASRTVFLFQTQCNSKELFHYLLNGLGVDAEGMELVSMHNKLNEILCREMLAGRRFVLAIDEAQNLEPKVLETIRLLSNFETSQTKMLQILLIGQPQLAQKLASPELEQLQQRISVFARLEPFHPDDAARYISHRIQVAGHEGAPLFTPEAIQIVVEHARGIPRKINSLCFSALSLGCALECKQIDAAIVREVIADRDLEPLQPRNAATQAEAEPEPVAAARPILTIFKPEGPKRTFGGWAQGAAAVAASVALGIGIFSYSSHRVGWFADAPSASRGSTQSSETFIRRILAPKSDSSSQASAINIQAAEVPNPAPSPFFVSGDPVEISSVTVQSGDTLRQIILRTVGRYSVDMVDQIRKLNPAITNFDHIEVGQVIRLPRIGDAVVSAAASESAAATGKN